MYVFPVQTNWWLEVKWPSGTPGTVPVGEASHRPGLDVFSPLTGDVSARHQLLRWIFFFCVGDSVCFCRLCLTHMHSNVPTR